MAKKCCAECEEFWFKNYEREKRFLIIAEIYHQFAAYILILNYLAELSKKRDR